MTHIVKKIITNSPQAWRLKGVAKRLSFAIANVMEQGIVPLMKLQVRTAGGGSVSVHRIEGMEIWRLNSGGKEPLIVELISAGNSYYGTYWVREKEIVKATDLKIYVHNYTEASGWRASDITEESCVCVVPSEPKNLVANVATDGSVSHREDWHRISFQWVGWPQWVSQICTVTPVESTMYHPGLSAAIYGGTVHWSHSPTTYEAMLKNHFIRHIDQEKRLYRPGRIDLKDDNTPGLYLMTETGKVDGPPVSYAMSIYGKKPFTRGADKKVSSYNERLTVGTGSWSINEGAPGSLQGGGNIQFNSSLFFWPFIPYMWEIPYFNVFEYAHDDGMYGRYMGPGSQPSHIRGWDLQYDVPAGASVSATKLSDTAEFIGQANTRVVDTAERPIWIPYGGPQSANGSWTDETTDNYSYEANVTKSVPIGPVCNGDVLFVRNAISLTGTRAAVLRTVNGKISSFDLYWYHNYPFYPGFYGENYACGTDTSNTVKTQTDDYNIESSVSSSLRMGSTIIDSGVGSMDYIGKQIKTITVDDTTTIRTTVESESYPGVWQWEKLSSGTRTDTERITGDMRRRLTLFAVLDYDSESNFKYNDALCAAVAVVYKKITVSHDINRIRTVDSTIDTGGYPTSDINNIGAGFNGWPREPGHAYGGTPLPPPGDVIVTNDGTTASGTRTVEYILYANVAGREYRKTLATFTGEIGDGSGQRCYGVVCKLHNWGLLVTYDLDNFVSPSNAQAGYDSPLNFEDWNSSAGVEMWETSKRMIGIVKLDDPDNFGVELFDAHPSTGEVDPITIPSEVYSVSAA